jgi:hypothetical protein
MREIQYDLLQPGVEYYIQNTGPRDRYSGKKIGKFRNVEMYLGVPHARFIELHDVPGAKRPSGMGIATENIFSSLGNRFYLPEKEEIEKQALLRGVLRGAINDPTFKPENYFYPAEPNNRGGKTKNKRRNKISNKRRNK